MAENEITFTECELVMKDQTPQLNVFGNKTGDFFPFNDLVYEIDCEIIDEKFFWMYIRIWEAKPYSNKVLNVDTKEISQNKREENEAELRKQLFCIYVPNEKIFYMSDFRKNKLLATYLKDRFKQEFIIKKYFIDPKEFTNNITSLKSLRFVGLNKNLFNGDIFRGVKELLGYDQDGFSFTLEVKKIKNSIFDPDKCLDFLLEWKRKKENRQVDRMVCVGKDDEGVEKIFNLETFLKKIKLSVKKDKNEMYNPQIVKNALLKELNAQSNLR